MNRWQLFRSKAKFRARGSRHGLCRLGEDYLANSAHTMHPFSFLITMKGRRGHRRLRRHKVMQSRTSSPRSHSSGAFRSHNIHSMRSLNMRSESFDDFHQTSLISTVHGTSVRSSLKGVPQLWAKSAFHVTTMRLSSFQSRQTDPRQRLRVSYVQLLNYPNLCDARRIIERTDRPRTGIRSR
jgi:hypothetical protein